MKIVTEVKISVKVDFFMFLYGTSKILWLALQSYNLCYITKKRAGNFNSYIFFWEISMVTKYSIRLKSKRNSDNLLFLNELIKMVSLKMAALKNFVKFRGKHSRNAVLSRAFGKDSHSSYSIGHLWSATSDLGNYE